MVTKWLGLWKQEKEGVYSGQVIKKADIPKYTRIVLRYNKYYDKDLNRPRFVYCFADSEGYEEMCVPIEADEDERPYEENGEYYTADGDRLYTESEVQEMLNKCAVYVGGDSEWGMHLVSDYN